MQSFELRESEKYFARLPSYQSVGFEPGLPAKTDSDTSKSQRLISRLRVPDFARCPGSGSQSKTVAPQHP